MTWGSGKLTGDLALPDWKAMEWFTGAEPDRSGIYQYLIAIMGPNDPKRTPREKRDFQGSKGTTRARRLKSSKGADVSADILKTLDRPMTFNEICLRLLDVNACDVLGGRHEKALWSLVKAEKVAFTMKAPVYFRRLP